MKNETAPRHLSARARERWRVLQHDYSISDSGGLAVLLSHCESYARADDAREQIAKDGATFVDRWGQPRPHPSVTIERDSRAWSARW